MRSRSLQVVMMGVLVIIGVTALPLDISQSQTTMALDTCKRLEFREHVNGSELVTRQCGRQFTSKDAYAGLVIQVRDIRDPIRVIAELLDPEQTTIWTQQFPIVPPSQSTDSYYAQYWIWAVLPIAADRAVLARENLTLAMMMIPVQGGKPVSERLGEWTWRARLERGAPLSQKFTLQRAP